MTTRSAHSFDVFTHADHTAQQWLGTVSGHLKTDDPHHAYRIVRAWVHTVRDRLSIEVAVHFAAQLPLVWRGVFYDGWVPRQVPVKYDVDQFLMTVAQDAGISVGEARTAVAAVTAALSELTSPDQIGHLLAQLPLAMREILDTGEGRHHRDTAGKPSTAPSPRTPSPTETMEMPLGRRVERLEQDLQIVVDALNSLVQGLDVDPTTEPEPGRFALAARQAHQIMLTRPGTGSGSTTTAPGDE